jgi:hypothetical protein
VADTILKDIRSINRLHACLENIKERRNQHDQPPIFKVDRAVSMQACGRKTDVTIFHIQFVSFESRVNKNRRS